MKLNKNAKGEIVGYTDEGIPLRNNPCGKTTCNIWLLIGIKFCIDCNREQEKFERQRER